MRFVYCLIVIPAIQATFIEVLNIEYVFTLKGFSRIYRINSILFNKVRIIIIIPSFIILYNRF